jgi:hypothetical protein
MAAHQSGTWSAPELVFFATVCLAFSAAVIVVKHRLLRDPEVPVGDKVVNVFGFLMPLAILTYVLVTKT